MPLSVRPPIYSLPSYSLTSDLLGFLRCGLQYRYTKIGRLPSARPVQLWFGQFIHGVLEESYRRYALSCREGNPDPPPWSEARLEEIRDLIKRRLAAQGIFAWDEDLEVLGDRRAGIAVNELGPVLFPLIHQAEVRLTGARLLPTTPEVLKYRFREADRYEMVGIVDVITHVQLNDPQMQKNQLVQLILSNLAATPPEQFEVIIDYKGMRRPPKKPAAAGPRYWDIYGWQVQTYAHLRSKQPDHLPVVAGAIVYLNELVPTPTDLYEMRQEIRAGETDVVPPPGSSTQQLIKGWKPDQPVPNLPLDFRLQRAIRVVEVSAGTTQAALTAFDDVVARIEICRGKEIKSGKMLSTWEKNASDESTCTACIAKTFCPEYTRETHPRVPGVKQK